MSVALGGRCLSGNARRACLAAVVLSPLLVLLSGALRNQQADNLLPAFFSTDHLGWFYWDQSRYGSIHSFLAFPIQNIRMNLLFQLHLRAASLVFLVVWIVESCARVNVKTGKTSLQYMFAFAFVVIFLCTFQEAGDALIYGANAHPIAIPFAILALSIQVSYSNSRIPVSADNCLDAMGCWFLGYRNMDKHFHLTLGTGTGLFTNRLHFEKRKCISEKVRDVVCASCPCGLYVVMDFFADR